MKKIFVAVIFLVGILTGLYFLLTPTPEKKSKRTSDAMEALTFWTRSRAYPAVDIPEDKYYAEYISARNRFKDTPKQLQRIAPWRAIGPHNIGGRTNALAINPLNPNTIYLGSASGGLWRTTTAGIGADAWEQVMTGFPVLGVNAIAINPLDTNILYIGTGEVYGYQRSIGGTVIRTTRGSYGIGILKTTNSGLSWTKSLDWSYNQQRGVQALKLNPLNPHTIYAATTEGILKSQDAGTTWTNVLPVLMGIDIVIHLTDTNRVMVSCGNLGSTGTGLYRTTDGGSSWTQLSGGLPSFTGKTHLAIFRSNPNIVFASIADSLEGQGIWQTIDFGTTWTRLSAQDIPMYQGWFSHYVAVHPTNSNIVYAGGVDFWKSTNGGTSFTRKSYWYLWYFGQPLPGEPEGPPEYAHADHHAFEFHPTNPTILYLATDGGLFCSTDGGETFEGRNGGYQTSQFYNGFSSSVLDSNLSMGGMQDNATALYLGTVAWYRVIGGDGCWTAINTVNDSIMYGEYQNNNIRKSTDRGVTFFPATTGLTGPGAAFVAPYVLAPSSPSILYSGRAHIYKTTDGAANWFVTNAGAMLDGNSTLSMAVSYTSPDTAYAATAPTITRANVFRTTNGGITWTNITGTLPNRYPMDIAVDPTNSRVVYVAFGGFGTGHIFKSTNAGGNWTDITGTLPDVPTSAVIVDPLKSDNVYVGNDIGVFASTNGGMNWITYSDGLPDAVIVSDLSISPTNRMLRVATHGNGAFERPLIRVKILVLLSPRGGENWRAGEIKQIRWSQDLISHLRLEYSSNNGSNWILIADNVDASDGVYDWTVPFTPTSQALVRITDLADTTLRRQSVSTFTISLPSVTVSVAGRWNLISLPVQRNDNYILSVFPTAEYGTTFDFTGSEYQRNDMLVPGKGYWTKFPGTADQNIEGLLIPTLTIEITKGWNLIGSISETIPVTQISSNPPGIITSQFFTYQRGYVNSTTIVPGKGYWVKVNQSGQLILSASSQTQPSNRIRIVPTSEQPPGVPME